MSILINVSIDNLALDACEVNFDGLRTSVEGTDVSYDGDVVLEGYEYCDYTIEPGDLSVDNDDIVAIIQQHCNRFDLEYIISEVGAAKQEVLTTKNVVAKMKAEGISFESLVREWFA